MARIEGQEMNGKRVIVIGGGLAGMAAAVALESAGYEVTLLEAARRLGGRASSFDDPQSGESLDNCQHVLLGCCTNLKDFYRRIGAEKLIKWEKAIRFADAAGRTYDLSASLALPAPLHLSTSVFKFNALTLSERLVLSLDMLAMMRADRRRFSRITFYEWLANEWRARLLPSRRARNTAVPATEGLLKKLYEPIITSALNETCANASAEYALQVFQESLLAHRDAYVMGLPNCSLSELYERLPCRDVRLGARVAAMHFDERGISAVELSDGQKLSADVYVLATNYHAVQRLIPESLKVLDERFRQLDKLQSVPILGAHLFFDRPVMPHSHVALIEGPLQWLFRKDAEGRVLHGVISAARDWVDVPKEEALKKFEEQVKRTFGAGDAKLVRGVVVIEKRATFSPSPEIDDVRPSQSPPPNGILNLYLAGDYTRSGWPATMEGAVRSGYLAAGEIAGKEFLVADLNPQWPFRVARATSP